MTPRCSPTGGCHVLAAPRLSGESTASLRTTGLSHVFRGTGGPHLHLEGGYLAPGPAGGEEGLGWLRMGMAGQCLGDTV